MAKKRYYQGGDDRKAESAGMEKYEHKMSSHKSSSKDMMPMYSDDFAAMPQEVIRREYSKDAYIGRPEYADTYAEKDRQNDKMISKVKKQEFYGV